MNQPGKSVANREIQKHRDAQGKGTTRTMSLQASISVAMCTYNGSKFVQEQLESIARQSRRPVELIVIDDRSTDTTVELVREFAKTAPFPVIIQVNEQNIGGSSKGITKNFEAAVALCQGDFIVPCDQDDIWVAEKLARMAGALEQTPGLDGAFSDAQLVTEKGVRKGIRLSQTTGLNAAEQRRIARGEALPLVLSMTKVYGSSLIFPSRLKQYLPVPPHWWFDAWMGTMAAVHGGLLFLPEELYLYRIHPNQSVSASVQTATKRMQRWRSSAKEYWKASEPQLRDLYDRLAAENNPGLQPHLAYLRGRMDLLQFRADLPANRLQRLSRILPRSQEYYRYFNGWRSLVKDLTA